MTGDSRWNDPVATGGAWIGVDLDGTLAHYDKWRGLEHIGEPIPAMIERVRGWLERGVYVRIFTARVTNRDRDVALPVIERWCKEHIGTVLPVTNVKDFGMIALWDDRAVQVEPNTGRALGDPTRGFG